MLMLIFSELKQLMTNFKIWLIDSLWLCLCLQNKKGIRPLCFKKKKKIIVIKNWSLIYTYTINHSLILSIKKNQEYLIIKNYCLDILNSFTMSLLVALLLLPSFKQETLLILKWVSVQVCKNITLLGLSSCSYKIKLCYYLRFN